MEKPVFQYIGRYFERWFDVLSPHSIAFLETLWAKEKMLVTSILSFSPNVYHPMWSENVFNLDKSDIMSFAEELKLYSCGEGLIIVTITRSLIHHFETVRNSKMMQTTTEMWLLKDFKIQIALKTLWKKVKLLILSNFTFFHNVFLKPFSSMC